MLINKATIHWKVYFSILFFLFSASFFHLKKQQYLSAFIRCIVWWVSCVYKRVNISDCSRLWYASELQQVIFINVESIYSWRIAWLIRLTEQTYFTLNIYVNVEIALHCWLAHKHKRFSIFFFLFFSNSWFYVFVFAGFFF